MMTAKEPDKPKKTFAEALADAAEKLTPSEKAAAELTRRAEALDALAAQGKGD